MHITGTSNPWDLMVHLAQNSLDGILHHVTQDVLLTEGEHDHLFPTGRMHQIMEQLTNAQTVTTRLFTAREGGEQHCQVGNAAVAVERRRFCRYCRH
jgi:homoserine acetyltransferase